MTGVTAGDKDRQQHSKCTLCRLRLLAASRSRVSMHPRRSARVAELQQPQALLGPLEGDFAKAFLGHVLNSLPLDERLRAREVCRGWRFFLKDASFWTHVDLGVCCSVNPRFLAGKDRTLALPACAQRAT